MKKTILLSLLFYFAGSLCQAQFPPQAPLPGHDAVAQDDARIVGWATGCTVQRGWQNIMDTTLGKTTVGTEQDATGAPGMAVLSLGDGGTAVLTFDTPIKDGPGPDFAIFENGFADPLNDTMAFLELAFVSVSSDGIHYVTFPATSLIPDSVQIDQTTYGYSDARLLHNLAGKYIHGYGTPFDLSELADSPNIDLQQVRYVKVTDVVGSIDPAYARYDHEGRVINDPFPTPFPSGGFDLNAVAVLNRQPAGIATSSDKSRFRLWPVPAREELHLAGVDDEMFFYSIYTTEGKRLVDGQGRGEVLVGLGDFPVGVYFVRCFTETGQYETLTFNKW